MTRKFDLILPIGEACCCSQSLRTAGLQFASFPWDWLAVRDLGKVVEINCAGGADFMRIEDMERLEPREGHPMDFYSNNRLGIHHNHDFPRGVPLEESFPAVAEKYRRRFNRQTRLIEDSKLPVLLLRIDSPIMGATTLDECRCARRRLSERFPGKTFEFCLFSLDTERPFASRIEEEVEPGFLHVAFDYRDRRPGAASYNVDQRAIAEVLRSRFAVRDYRTAEEKRRYADARKAEKYAKAGVDSVLGYRLYRLKKQIRGLFGRR